MSANVFIIHCFWSLFSYLMSWTFCCRCCIDECVYGSINHCFFFFLFFFVILVVHMQCLIMNNKMLVRANWSFISIMNSFIDGPRTNEAIVVYDNPEAAIYAKLVYYFAIFCCLFIIHLILHLFSFIRDKLHGLEYPMGERIIVKVSGMSSSRIDTSFINSTC